MLRLATRTLVHRGSLRAFTTAPGKLERVCIVGSGPAGFYTAKYLLHDHPTLHVDMLEALPTPYGLVRSGVAPDHPEVKNVMHDFEKVANDPRFSFMGNVDVGHDVTIEELHRYYNAVVIAAGASDDRKLNIPGEDELTGVLAARSFVNWYNGHPSFRNLNVPLDCDAAVVIGQGNVAVDCARILTKTPDELATTDISQHALDALAASGIKTVYLVGRRGAAQAAFTMKELREITKLPNADCIVEQEELMLSMNESSYKEIDESRAQRRIFQLLTSVSKTPDEAKGKAIRIRFLLSPIEVLPDPKDPSRVGAIKVEKNGLVGEPNSQQARGTGEFETIPCGLVLRSIGYKSTPLEGVPFDSKRHVIPNVAGRVINPETNNVVSGLYCTGWIKRGPSGIIGTNITDARETAASVLADEASTPPKALAPVSELRASIKTPIIDWSMYSRIEKYEADAGAAKGKPREKLTSIDTMVRVAQGENV
ncbi:unnamed protein product [Aphanomyces euteiches]|nr:hypothetical protein AeRB84_015131 [Aphanomyces euteiches]KAH9148748.1 hypothetical protein AeRB84_007998 [Aphanomyces euteiches]KAH9150717.1 hypothetical protein AeRB84_006503 [Aphanomyces euteiches]KAH9152402.1 hypothetical protein AeRB84_005180 [Aphanomyces euteiches]KAH9153862.1 hypothetical protein AeRB84_003950 [Aphanomyces euteiches]